MPGGGGRPTCPGVALRGGRQATLEPRAGLPRIRQREFPAVHRRDLRRVEYGDERDPKQRAKLLEISPLTQIDKLSIPLLVVTGANDPRVPKSEADQAVAAVRAKGRSAWHLIGMNEGHGFAKKENADYQFWTELMFWKANLLGQK